MSVLRPILRPILRPVLRAALDAGNVGSAILIAPNTLGPGVTFSRSTLAWGLGVDGTTWQSWLADVARFVGATMGLLIEGQRSNANTNPRTVGGTGWSSQGVTVTMGGGAPAPDNTGAPTNRVTDDPVASSHYTFRSAASTFGEVTTMSAILRGGPGAFAQLCFTSAGWGTGSFANFDLTAGTVTLVGFNATARIRRLGNGWFWCEVSAAATSNNSNSTGYMLALENFATAGRLASYTGTGLYLDVWTLWIERNASFASTPIFPPVGTQAVSTRAADVPIYPLTGAAAPRAAKGRLRGTALVPQISPDAQGIVMLDNATADDRMGLRIAAGGASVVAFRVVGGVEAVSPSLGTVTPGTAFDFDFAWGVAGITASLNGGATQTISGPLPPGTRVVAGHGKYDPAATGAAVYPEALFGEIASLTLAEA